MWGILVSVLIGALAGFIAGRIMNKGMSLLVCILVGIVGGFLGSSLFGWLSFSDNPSFWGRLFVGIVGSVILLWLVSKIKKK